MAYEYLSYTRHTLMRMEERDIREEEVLRVMNNPDLTYTSYGKRVSEDVFEGNRLIQVVFVDTPGSAADARIISAIRVAVPFREFCTLRIVASSSKMQLLDTTSCYEVAAES